MLRTNAGYGLNAHPVIRNSAQNQAWRNRCALTTDAWAGHQAVAQPRAAAGAPNTDHGRGATLHSVIDGSTHRAPRQSVARPPGRWFEQSVAVRLVAKARTVVVTGVSYPRLHRESTRHLGLEGNVVSAIGDALAAAGTMAWQMLWALIFGFALSTVIQAVVRIDHRAIDG